MSENLYREGFPTAQQFFVTNLDTRRCYWHNNRYTISHYLCDKEFRYLRIVRVTTSIYRGFRSKLITFMLPSFQHQACVRLYTLCYHLAESRVFNKQSPPLLCAAFLIKRLEGTSSPKVTGSFCRAPSTWFSQAP
nr:glycosyl transferase (glycosyl transferase family 2) [Ipomoea batatas]